MLSTLVGGVLYAVTARSIESNAYERFSNHAKYAQSVIGVRVKSYSDLLRSAGSMLQSTDVISHRTLHMYVAGLNLAKNFPAVDSLNYAARVTDERRGEFMEALRKEMQGRVKFAVPLDITPPGRRGS